MEWFSKNGMRRQPWSPLAPVMLILLVVATACHEGSAFSMGSPFVRLQRSFAAETKVWDSEGGNVLDELLNTTLSDAIRQQMRRPKRNGRTNGEQKGDNLSATTRRNSFWTMNVFKNARDTAGTLGDIMSRGSDGVGVSSPSSAKESSAPSLGRGSGLVTSAGKGTLVGRFGIEHPLDRMALTANGNLQRLVSSYYDAPVQVVVDYCEPVSDCEEVPVTFPNNLQYSKFQPKQWERTVHLTVHNQTFCTAHSQVTVFDPFCQELVESGQVGLGQLFRYLDILPEFELHDAGQYPAERGGGFWREYTLRCAELSCDIHEDFQSGVWEIRPQN